MKTIAFVIPWFGENIPGGAEMLVRGITTHLNEAGVDVEILTTCVKEFVSDWNENYYKEGPDVVLGVKVRRFKVKPRNTEKFGVVNLKLMRNEKISPEEEEIFCREMVNSTDLYKYIEENKDNYEFFVFIPYMFGTTYYGCQVCPEKSILIPCFHDESYAYLECFKKAFSKVAGMIFNAKPELELTEAIYDVKEMNKIVLGVGLDTDLEYDAKRFREKYQLDAPFILYAGRKDEGKNVHTLLRYFAEYKSRHNTDMKIVLIGGGEIAIPKAIKDDVIDLGFVDRQDKYDACAAATLLCQPSHNESFSLVIMESWLCGRPVIVSGACAVTKQFAIDTNGGLYFDNYFEFEGAVNYIVQNEEVAIQMGKNGCKYVKEHFAWDVIVENCVTFFENVAAQNKKI